MATADEADLDSPQDATDRGIAGSSSSASASRVNWQRLHDDEERRDVANGDGDQNGHAQQHQQQRRRSDQLAHYNNGSGVVYNRRECYDSDELSESERLKPMLKSRSPSPPVRRRKPCLVQRSFDAFDTDTNATATAATAAGPASAGAARRDSSCDRRPSRRQSEENGGIELIGAVRASDLARAAAAGDGGGVGHSTRRLVAIWLADGGRFLAEPEHFLGGRYPDSLLARVCAQQDSSSSSNNSNNNNNSNDQQDDDEDEAAAEPDSAGAIECHLPDGVSTEAFRALLGLYSPEGRVRWRPAGAAGAAAAATSSSSATASRRSSDATTATTATTATGGFGAAAAVQQVASGATSPSPAELRLACRLLGLPFEPDAMRGCPDLRGLLHEISNDGAKETFAQFLEESLLPQLASCAMRGERECQLVVLADDDVVDWDPDNPPQMADWDLQPEIVHSTGMCRFLKYVENRDVAKQVLRERRLKKIRIGIEGYPTRVESVKRRAGGREDAIYSYAQRPFLRVSWEKEENRHVDFQCVVQVKGDVASEAGLQAAAVERPVDLPPSLTPPLPASGSDDGADD